MLALYVRAKDALTHLRRDESGQDAFEYLLTIGVIMTAVVVGVAFLFPSTGTGFITTVVDAVETKITGILA
jgi:Flp pilus assembly pilin Flp